jgi:hypothetical protein
MASMELYMEVGVHESHDRTPKLKDLVQAVQARRVHW